MFDQIPTGEREERGRGEEPGKEEKEEGERRKEKEDWKILVKGVKDSVKESSTVDFHLFQSSSLSLAL